LGKKPQKPGFLEIPYFRENPEYPLFTPRKADLAKTNRGGGGGFNQPLIRKGKAIPGSGHSLPRGGFSSSAARIRPQGEIWASNPSPRSGEGEERGGSQTKLSMGQQPVPAVLATTASTRTTTHKLREILYWIPVSPIV